MRVYPLMLILLFSAMFCAGGGCAAMGQKDTTYNPQINPADFVATVDNPYFPLVPGTVMTYTEKSGGETIQNVFTVTNETKMIMGVKCTVVRDTATENGVVKEDTFDWFVQDKHGNVWYFGEDTKEFAAGGGISTKGSWEAGVDGAKPGIIMPANPKPGAPYRQEYYHGEAEDMGQVVAVGQSVAVPAGSYPDCVKTRDWSLLEAGSEHKWYARGVGMVRAESAAGDVATLISITRK